MKRKEQTETFISVYEDFKLKKKTFDLHGLYNNMSALLVLSGYDSQQTNSVLFTDAVWPRGYRYLINMAAGVWRPDTHKQYIMSRT